MSYLIDTNVISELKKLSPNEQVISWFKDIPPDAIYISVLTIGEIRKGAEKLEDEKRKEDLRIWLERDLPQWFGERILPIDMYVAERWGRLLSEIKRTIPAIVSLIAATALHHDLRVVTRSVSDFKFPSLQVINPWG